MPRPALRALTLGLLLACLSGLTGCVSHVLAKKFVEAPNLQRQPRMVWDKKFRELVDRTYTSQFTVPVGPPGAVLAVATLEPADYQLKSELVMDGTAEHGLARYSLNWNFPDPKLQKPEPRGTIVLLHGILVSKETVMHWGLYLAEKGYRTVLVDLRGHGLSSGEWVTFGAVEKRDLSQILDELERRGLAKGKVGVLGVSYGASVALEWAAQDPRVGAVVALEPFRDARAAIEEFSRGFAPDQVRGVSDAQFAAADADAARMAGFRWDDADVMGSVRALRVPVFYLHGAWDNWLSVDNSRLLFAASPKGSRLEILPFDNHVTLSTRLNPIAPEVLDWFDSHLKAP